MLYVSKSSKMLPHFGHSRLFLLLFYVFFVCYGQPTNESPSANKTEIEGVLDYLTKYMSFSVEGPHTSASSSNGDTNSEARPTTEEIASSPAFVENVLLIQSAAGLDKTGVPDAALLKQVRKSRCGMSDPPPAGSGIAEFSENSRWMSTFKRSTGKYHLTYSFFTETFPEGLTTDIKKGILAAMCLWEKNSNIRFTEDLGRSVSSAHVTISFGQASHGDGFPFDGEGGTLAHAFYPESGKLHFDLAENWYLSTNNNENRNGKDIFVVGAHELGHILGLKHSGVSSALMAPYYRFINSLEYYTLPTDEQEGMIELYGSISERSVATETNSACYRFSRNYGTGATPTKLAPTPRPTTQPKPTTIPKPGGIDCSDKAPEQTCQNFKMSQFCEQYPEAVEQLCPLTCAFCNIATCFDQYSLKKCTSWKESGYCTKSNGVQSMVRLCQSTCGYCPVVVENKPAKRTITPKTVCDIQKFDAVSVRNDYGKYFYADFIKEDYYFPVEVQLTSYFSLLDKTSVIEDFLQWAFDPKVVPAVHYKYNSQRKFLKTDNVKAVLRTQALVLIVQKNGQVDEYRNDGPYPVHVSSHALSDVFIGHPFATVDTAYSEYDRTTGEYVITLFNHQSIWQYKESILSMYKTRYSGVVGRQFDLIGSKPIKNWLGVDACDVDAVFNYKGSPYFLKNNIFWPASDKQPQIARDVSYNIFRCWKSEPQNLRIPFECNSGIRNTLDLKCCIFVLLIFFMFTLY